MPGHRGEVVGVDDRGGRLGASSSARVAAAPDSAEKSDSTWAPGSSPASAERALPGVAPGAAVDHAQRAGDVGDPAVPELDQVLDRGLDAGGVVDPDGRPEGLVERGPDDDGRQPELGEQRGALVVDGQVGDQDAVDPALGGQPAVRRLVVALGDLEQQRVARARTAPTRGRR